MSIVSEYLSTLQWGECQSFAKMTLLPLIDNSPDSSVYLTLREALTQDVLKITEVDNQGSVPVLKANNMSSLPVLILDGEELVGSRQNRVLNTTLLLEKKSVTLIPVSCTEEGRWHYNSREFYDTGSVVSHKIRDSKRRSVTNSMRLHNQYQSDQHSIWDEIRSSFHSKNFHSPTQAHRDIFQSLSDEIEEYLYEFPLMKNQVGIMVFINGKIIGLDTISSPAAYQKLHVKLLKSYVMEAVLDKKYKSTDKFNPHQIARLFFNHISETQENQYKSLGHGWDHRFESDHVLGSALLCPKEVIHASFFKNEKVDYQNSDKMASSRWRRSFRS